MHLFCILFFSRMQTRENIYLLIGYGKLFVQKTLMEDLFIQYFNILFLAFSNKTKHNDDNLGSLFLIIIFNVSQVSFRKVTIYKSQTNLQRMKCYKQFEKLVLLVVFFFFFRKFKSLKTNITNLKKRGYIYFIKRKYP